MSKYKPNPIKYNNGEMITKIRIEDDTGALMENWTIMFSDLWKWARAMRLKYNAKFEEPKGKIEKDLDWAKKF